MRSYDEGLFPYVGPDVTAKEWLSNENNVMLDAGGSVGLFTYEYPGVYSGHWFFKVRGREALDLAEAMLAEFFKKYPAQAIRGLTPISNKAARWAARKIGMKSYGFLSYPNDEDHELFCMTKDEFYEQYL